MDQPKTPKSKKRKLTDTEIEEECEVLSDIGVNQSDGDIDFFAQTPKRRLLPPTHYWNGG